MTGLRFADHADADAVAHLHATSWSRHYRGIYPDAYLDHQVGPDMTASWRRRLGSPADADRTVLAEDGRGLVGFVHVELAEHPTWGSLVGHLHVDDDAARSGVGSALVLAAAATVLDATPDHRLYVQVLEGNADAQRFYRALGARCVGRIREEVPGGGATVPVLQFSWPDVRTLRPSSGPTVRLVAQRFLLGFTPGGGGTPGP